LANEKKKNVLIHKVLSLTKEIHKRFQNEDDEERQWLLDQCKNPEIIVYLKELTVTMLHVIDAVGNMQPVNGVTIASKLDIPKGSVSKITRKLLQRAIVQQHSLPYNNKEKLFSLTSIGHEIYKLHQALDQQIARGVQSFMQKYNKNELHFLIRCMEDTIKTSWVNPESIQRNRKAEPLLLENDYMLQKGSTAEINQFIEKYLSLSEKDQKKAHAILEIVFPDKH
jgi:DNA-binding MarR family transcriptional regulator